MMEAGASLYLRRFGLDRRPAHSEHALGGIEAADVDASPSGGDKDASATAPELENWATALAGGSNVEVNVWPRRVRRDVWGELSDER